MHIWPVWIRGLFTCHPDERPGTAEQDEAILLPFVFRKNEQVLLVRLGTHYYEDTKVQRTYMGTGILVITTKHVYFECAGKSLRIAFKSIAACQPYDDGFILCRDARSALPQTFITGQDGEDVLAIMNQDGDDDEA